MQARPETVQSQTRASVFRHYALLETAEPYITGVAVGQAIAAGPVARLESPNEMTRFRPGDVLVTKRTDPDWGPIMKQAAAIITDEGGRTSHAAIVSRELGVPAVVGTQSAPCSASTSFTIERQESGSSS